jgi:hypothetical protein
MSYLIPSRIAALALALLVTPLLVGGCGGSSSERTTVGAGSATNRESHSALPATAKQQEHVQARKRQADRNEPRRRHRSRKVVPAGNKAGQGGEPEDPKGVSERLKGLLNGAGSKKHVITAPKKIREVLKALDDGSQKKNGAGNSVDATLEKVLGDG